MGLSDKDPSLKAILKGIRDNDEKLGLQWEEVL
jgi:hypothetical protein